MTELKHIHELCLLWLCFPSRRHQCVFLVCLFVWFLLQWFVGCTEYTRISFNLFPPLFPLQLVDMYLCMISMFHLFSLSFFCSFAQTVRRRWYAPLISINQGTKGIFFFFSMLVGVDNFYVTQGSIKREAKSQRGSANVVFFFFRVGFWKVFDYGSGLLR